MIYATHRLLWHSSSAYRVGHGMSGDIVRVRLVYGKARRSGLSIKGSGGSHRCSSDVQTKGIIHHSRCGNGDSQGLDGRQAGRSTAASSRRHTDTWPDCTLGGISRLRLRCHSGNGFYSSVRNKTFAYDLHRWVFYKLLHAIPQSSY